MSNFHWTSESLRELTTSSLTFFAYFISNVWRTLHVFAHNWVVHTFLNLQVKWWLSFFCESFCFWTDVTTGSCYSCLDLLSVAYICTYQGNVFSFLSYRWVQSYGHTSVIQIHPVVDCEIALMMMLPSVSTSRSSCNFVSTMRNLLAGLGTIPM